MVMRYFLVFLILMGKIYSLTCHFTVCVANYTYNCAFVNVTQSTVTGYLFILGDCVSLLCDHADMQEPDSLICILSRFNTHDMSHPMVCSKDSNFWFQTIVGMRAQNEIQTGAKNQRWSSHWWCRSATKTLCTRQSSTFGLMEIMAHYKLINNHSSKYIYVRSCHLFSPLLLPSSSKNRNFGSSTSLCQTELRASSSLLLVVSQKTLTKVDASFQPKSSFFFLFIFFGE